MSIDEVQPTENAPVESEKLHRDSLELLEIFMDLDEEARKRVIEIVKIAANR